MGPQQLEGLLWETSHHSVLSTASFPEAEGYRDQIPVEKRGGQSKRGEGGLGSWVGSLMQFQSPRHLLCKAIFRASIGHAAGTHCHIPVHASEYS